MQVESNPILHQALDMKLEELLPSRSARTD
jgi:hypothetical protein